MKRIWMLLCFFENNLICVFKILNLIHMSHYNREEILQNSIYISFIENPSHSEHKIVLDTVSAKKPLYNTHY